MQKKKHKHKWEYVAVRYEFPMGMTGTAAPIQYGYLLCQCTVVKRVVVQEEEE